MRELNTALPIKSVVSHMAKLEVMEETQENLRRGEKMVEGGRWRHNEEWEGI
jgi:hypothetical protein